MDDYNETDNESYDSWETDDEPYDFEDITYDSEEISSTKYNIVLCIRYNVFTHGIAGEAINHYLTHIRLKKIDLDFINDIKVLYPALRLEIAECFYLPSQHCVSIIKTHWLKLIQRTWKKICRDRKLTILRRSYPNSLKYREIFGSWPKDCINYPRLKGMLSRLSRGFT